MMNNLRRIEYWQGVADMYREAYVDVLVNVERLERRLRNNLKRMEFDSDEKLLGVTMEFDSPTEVRRIK